MMRRPSIWAYMRSTAGQEQCHVERGMEELFLHSLPDHERAVALGMHGGTQRTHYADRHHDGGDKRGDKHDDGHHLTEIYGLQEHRVQEEIGCDDESRDDLVPEHPLEDVLLEYLIVHLRLQDDFVDIDDVGDLEILLAAPQTWNTDCPERTGIHG